jgi:glyoxylase-like metal-dependent hydrolase (beta-lactamase superfamily II)
VPVMTINLVEPGIHRIATGSVNCYLIENGDALAFVDAGLPRTWFEADHAVRALGRTWADVQAIVLTHGHFDHLGFAARAEREHGVPVWVHHGDARIATHPYRYRPGRPRLLYPLFHPRAVPHLATMMRDGALRVPGVRSPRTFGDDHEPDFPAGLHALATPGHTDGHCALHLTDRDVLFTGDGLVTLDPYTGRRGPRIVARAGTKDAETAERSLAVMAETDASTLLPGHGEPWTDGVDDAVKTALRRSAA